MFQLLALCNVIKIRPSKSTMFYKIIAAVETTAFSPLGISAMFLSPHPVLSAPWRWAVEMSLALLVAAWAATHFMTSIMTPAVNPCATNQPVVRVVPVGLAALQLFLMCSDAIKQLAVFLWHPMVPVSAIQHWVGQPLSCHFPSYHSSGCQPLSYLSYGCEHLSYLIYSCQPLNYLTNDHKPWATSPMVMNLWATFPMTVNSWATDIWLSTSELPDLWPPIKVNWHVTCLTIEMGGPWVELGPFVDSLVLTSCWTLW